MNSIMKLAHFIKKTIKNPPTLWVAAICISMIAPFATSFAVQSIVPAPDCFLVKEKGKILDCSVGDATTAWSPCSTFKILLALIGYDCGILIDENTPVHSFKPGYVAHLDSWREDQNPKSWMKNSCVWYSQEIITKPLGMAQFTHYVRLLGYGNQDLTGDVGQNNGLTQSWLSSSLLISSEQQAAFLEKLIADQLPVSLAAHTKTRNILFIEPLHKGWNLYGKTGSGRQLDAQGHKTDLQHGWFVGWITKNERTIVFVYHKADGEKMTDYASHRAKQAAKDQLINLIDHLEADTPTQPKKRVAPKEQ